MGSAKSEGVLALQRDAPRAVKQGVEGLERRQRARLAELVAFARANSPYYRELYRDLPARVEQAALLPVTSKAELMARFDDWATDREVTIARARAFAEDSELIGKPFLGRYLLASSSGTTGVRGTFVMDDRAMRVADALRLRALRRWLSAGEAARILAAGGRTANISGIHAHFVGSEIARRGRWRRRAVRPFSAQAPMPELVAGLNRLRPAILSGYASMIGLLAAEQEAGRLRISPVLVALSSEGISPIESDRVAEAFGAKLRTSYAAAECPFMAHSCERGWLHVNSDWVVLEPVDANGRPVAPGERSDGVLVSNLANRVQPILRYSLGDRILRRPDPCPCGSPQPAIRVEGRVADVLTVGNADEAVEISALSLQMVFEGIPGLQRLQIVQTAPATLRVRSEAAETADPDRVWEAIQAALRGHLTDRSLGQVRIERGDEPIEQTAGGKLRKVIPLTPAAQLREAR